MPLGFHSAGAHVFKVVVFGVQYAGVATAIAVYIALLMIEGAVQLQIFVDPGHVDATTVTVVVQLIVTDGVATVGPGGAAPLGGDRQGEAVCSAFAGGDVDDAAFSLCIVLC